MASASGDCLLGFGAVAGVKAQTADSIAAARAAGKTVLVAFNKCDKENADVGRVAGDLTAHGLLVEDLGGQVQRSDQ